MKNTTQFHLKKSGNSGQSNEALTRFVALGIPDGMEFALLQAAKQEKGSSPMKSVLVSCALIAGVIAAAIASPMQGKLAEKNFLSNQQQVSPASPQAEITGSIGLARPTDNRIADSDESVKGLSCEQIRIMDEVELITDDSYCT